MSTELLTDILLWPWLAGLAVALAAGPLGAFVVWRRLAFFGDTLAHGALLGVAAGLGLGLSLYPAVVGCSLLLALLLALLQQQRQVAGDTLLGIVSHTALAGGIVALSLLPTVQVDVMSFLFGDLLSVGAAEAVGLMLGSIGLLTALVLCWRPLVSATVNEELARVEGVPVVPLRLLLMLMLALLVAGALRTVGVLLITSLLVIPAAAARRWSHTPAQMALLASLIGMLAVTLGLACSWTLDTPLGPSIVLAAAGLFLLTSLFPRRS